MKSDIKMQGIKELDQLINELKHNVEFLGLKNRLQRIKERILIDMLNNKTK